MTAGRNKLALAVAAFLAGALLLWWAWPEPLPVETARVVRGAVAASVEEDGETRARDRYVVAAPVAGRLLRIRWREGDAVKAGDVVAEVAPRPLSSEERAQLEAKLSAAGSLEKEARERVARAKADREQAQRERRRVEDLVERRFMSAQALEQAVLAERLRENDVDSALARAAAAAADARAAAAALTAVRSNAPTVPARSPVDGRVLSIPEKSERVVAAGTPLAVVGDPRALEIVVDLLSSDAVNVRPGMKMIVTGWGGARPLDAIVRMVEPAAFRKVSALGVEEQRVNVVADFTAPPPGLGDAYRIDARIVVAEKPDALKVPVGALFRRGARWAVFVVEEGRARAREVEVGLFGPREAEIVAGLAERERVVLYPGNDLADGGRVSVREGGAPR